MSDSTTTALDFYGAAWMAERIDMSEDWVRHNTKRIPHHKVGRLVKFDEHCVERYAEQTAIYPNEMRQTEKSARRNGASR